MPDLSQLLAILRDHHGEPALPPANSPFEFIVWENAVYLLPFERRLEVFESLRSQVGLSPEAILQADPRLLLTLARRGGMRPETRVFRWLEIARIANLHGKLNDLLSLPWDQAKRILKQFPTIGDPGAEKILLFCGRSDATLTLESNGLRVLTRFGYGRSQKSYGATYKSVQAHLTAELPMTDKAMAHRLLCEHGQTICKRNGPHCTTCPARSICAQRL